MRITRSITAVTSILTATLFAAAPALAEDAPAGEPVKTAEVDPTVETAPGTPAPADAPPAEATDEEEEDTTTGWFRVDTDSLETQFWLGATHSVGSFAIASDIYVVGSFAEFDIGPSFNFGSVTLTPMAGIGFDFETQNLASLIAPQLFTIVDLDQVYFESWIQLFFNGMFDDSVGDVAYTRNFALYKAGKKIAVGPQVEVSYQLDDVMDDTGMVASTSGVTSLPVGGRVNLGYGKNNTLGLFLGYDTKAADGSDGVAGRFTFIRTW